MKTVPRILRAVAVLQNKAGDFVQPEADSGSEALAGTATIDQPGGLRLFLPNPDRPGSHPLVSLSWILLYEEYSDPAKAAAFKDALVWGLTEEQPIAEEMGYIPLPEAITSKAIRVLAGLQ